MSAELMAMAKELQSLELKLKVQEAEKARVAEQMHHGTYNSGDSTSTSSNDDSGQEDSQPKLEQRLCVAQRSNAELQSRNENLQKTTEQFEQQNEELKRMLAATAVAEMAGGAGCYNSPRTLGVGPDESRGASGVSSQEQRSSPNVPCLDPNSVFVRREEIISLINERDRLKRHSMSMQTQQAQYASLKSQYDELFHTILLLKTRNEELRDKLMTTAPTMPTGPMSQVSDAAHAPYGYAEGAIRLMPSTYPTQ